MGFTKLDSGIVQSSIMLEDSDTFKAWIIFLASCDSDGIARVSPVYISSICHFTIEKTMQIIKKLESPDELSRSINNEGKRIERVDGGYKIINYLKYREFTYSDSKEAIKKRRQREGHKGDMSPNHGDTLSSVLLKSSEEDRSEEERIEEIYKLYPNNDINNVSKSTGKSSKNKDKIARILKTKYPLKKAIEFYLSECKRTKCYLKNFSTFLNNLPDIELLEDKKEETEQTLPQVTQEQLDIMDEIFGRKR